MSLAIIRKAFESRLKTYGLTKALPIAYEGVDFNPPTSMKYLKCYLLPAATQAPTLDGVMREYAGVFQVTVVVPSNIGNGLLSQIAQELDAVYPASFVQDSVRVFMTQPMGASRIESEGGTSEMVVYGNYKAHV